MDRRKAFLLAVCSLAFPVLGGADAPGCQGGPEPPEDGAAPIDAGKPRDGASPDGALPDGASPDGAGPDGAPADASSDTSSPGDPGGDASPDPSDGGTGGTGPVVFRVDQAIVGGTACEASVVSVPGGIGVRYRDLRVTLPTPSTTTALRQCTVRVPLEVPAGFYIKRLRQKVVYSLRKTTGVEVSMGGLIGAFGVTPDTLAVPIPAGTVDRSGAVETRDDTFGPDDGLGSCDGRPSAGILRIDTGIGARLADPQGSLSAAVLDQDFVAGSDFELARCP